MQRRHTSQRSDAHFATAITCIDGRVQVPVIEWICNQMGVDFVDMITVPGADWVLAFESDEQLAEIRRRVEVSTDAHGSQLLIVAGHHDCAANPVSDFDHQEHIRKAVQAARRWQLPVRIVGVWINGDWQVEVVDDGS